jgi:MscS family membrane protein
MDIVVDAGSSFAFPSRTTYVEQGTPLPEARAKAIEERVREWKDKNELFLPSFPSDRITALRGTVQYPPAGSPDAGGDKS